MSPTIARGSSPEFGHTGQGHGYGEIELQPLSTSTSTAQASASKSVPSVDDPAVDATSQWELKKRASLAMTMDDVQAVEIYRCDAAMIVCRRCCVCGRVGDDELKAGGVKVTSHLERVGITGVCVWTCCIGG